MENVDVVAAWIIVALVLIIFLSIASADGYNRNWQYDDGISSSSPAMAAWILLIACGALLLIVMCACCICTMWQQQQQQDQLW